MTEQKLLIRGHREMYRRELKEKFKVKCVAMTLMLANGPDDYIASEAALLF